jgi:hypothetical protein
VKLLVTGGSGFIGSNLIRHLLRERSEVELVNLDALTYAGNLENLKGIEDDPRYRFVHGDIRGPEVVAGAMEGADVVVNFAAESHVDRSIVSAFPFLRTNVEGTLVLLEAARAHGVGRFVQVSTDEVYGSLEWRDPSEPDREEDGQGREEDDREHDGKVEYCTEETPPAPRPPGPPLFCRRPRPPISPSSTRTGRPEASRPFTTISPPVLPDHPRSRMRSIPRDRRQRRNRNPHRRAMGTPRPLRFTGRPNPGPCRPPIRPIRHHWPCKPC